MKLTTTTVKTAELPAGKTEAIFFDDDIPGFGLRLREGGSRGFVFQYKLGAKHRRMALGKATALNLAEIRKLALQHYASVRRGEDPAADKADALRRVSETFKFYMDQYLDTLRQRLRPRSLKEIKRHLTKHAKPLHQIQLTKITRRDVAALHVAITSGAGARTANLVRSSVSAFFTWAMARGLAESNPVIGTEKNEEKSRDRVLTPSELRLIWNALDGQHGACIKLLALTAQRLKEIGDLRWSEVHDDEITLPAARTKNGRDHVVPLSEAAAAIIAQQPKGVDDLIFGNGKRGFQIGQIAKYVWTSALQRRMAASQSRIGRRTIYAEALPPMSAAGCLNISLRSFQSATRKLQAGLAFSRMWSRPSSITSAAPGAGLPASITGQPIRARSAKL